MWTNHEEIEAVLESLVRYDEATAAGRRVMPFYSERLSIRGGYNSGAQLTYSSEPGRSPSPIIT
jgi:hypothetical protein